MGATLASAFFVLSLEAIDEFSFSDMEELLRKRGRTKTDLPRLERFASGLDQCRFAFRLALVVVRAVLAVVLWRLVQEILPDAVEWLRWAAFLGLVAGITLGIDVALRPVAAAFPEQLALALLRVWRGLNLVLWLPTWPLRILREAIERLFTGMGDRGEEAEQGDDDILAAVSMSEYAGDIDPAEREMIESVLALDSTTVERLMTPRTDMKAIDVEDGVSAVLALAKESGHSRIPIYADNRDNIIGMCYVKDLIGLDPENGGDLRSLLRDPLLVPASKKVSELLTEFRRSRVHIAVVLDEYGGTAGLITIEDIVEEVFGDIDDEHDAPTEEEVRTGVDGVLELEGRLRVDEVNERFDANLPEGDNYESIGGLLTSRFGRIPEVGEVWEEGRHRLRVLEATDRRVVRVSLERLGEGREDSD